MALSAVLERTTRLRTEEEEQISRAAEEHNRRSMESYRTLVSEARTDAKPNESGSPYARSAADFRAVEMPESENTLFRDVEYRDGSLVHTSEPEAETAAAMQTEAVYETAPAPSEEEESEDARPTSRTLETLNRYAAKQAEATEERVGFFASLSTRAKVALAVVALAVLVALVLVFVNTGILSGLESSLAAKQIQLAQLTETSQSLRAQLNEITDPNFVDYWARTVMGMVRS